MGGRGLGPVMDLDVSDSEQKGSGCQALQNILRAIELM
jgi:hypothetical protein